MWAVILAVLGTVQLFVDAKSDFDVWTKNPTPEQQQFMRDNYTRMQTYSPYFDSRLTWYPRAWAYKDAMAIKSHWPIYSAHPDWVLKDSQGRQIYINWGCSDTGCPQWGADIGNPEFRRWWIDSAKALIDKGYAGLWIDDVNLDWRFVDQDLRRVTPVDPRTGSVMTLANWRRYFAEFMEQVREELFDIEIAHNSIWFAEYDEYVQRQINAADWINLERGVTDSGITDGEGRFSLVAFMHFINLVHASGKRVILDDDNDNTDAARDYELAFYLLIKKQGDLLGSDGNRNRMNPVTFWPGYLLNLGNSRGDYYLQDGRYYRDFDKGQVIVSPPPNPLGLIIYDEINPAAPKQLQVN